MEQKIHTLVKVNSSSLNWIFTVVYASPRHRERCILWNNLNTIANSHNLPWIVVGDFNEMLSNDGKLGGRPISLYRANLFKECLDSCNMADLGFNGPRFTWTNKHDIGSLIQERLDRLSRPFGFQSSWLADDSFPNLVQDAWSNNPGLYDAIKKFTTKAAEWNRVHFGNIFAKKRRVLARLGGIQRVMADRPSSFLINLEKQL
ncbi:uncharacterized protein LOC115956530 [Quercus lobata]|uniref:uncharacterized protein LOC115956530 n=1 Tax=Quercus lobata TaxID=97700 RepID=UPI0012458EAE|nr:uncharacterized protein LOC115956530 [Quercus lobata]